jgi:hypothetical protein
MTRNKNDDEAGATQEQAAKELDLSRRRLRDLKAEGRVVLLTNGRIDVEATRAALEAVRADPAAEELLPGDLSLDAAKREQAAYAARKTRREVETLAEGFEDRAVVERVARLSVAALGAELGGWPAAVAVEVAGMTEKRDVVAALERGLTDRLHAVAARIERDDPDDAEADDTTSPTSSLRRWLLEDADDAPPTRAEAERRRAVWAARLEAVRAWIAEGELMDRESVDAAAFQAGRAARDKLLSLPMRASDRVLACAGEVANVEAVLREEVEPVLEEHEVAALAVATLAG